MLLIHRHYKHYEHKLILDNHSIKIPKKLIFFQQTQTFYKLTQFSQNCYMEIYQNLIILHQQEDHNLYVLTLISFIINN